MATIEPEQNQDKADFYQLAAYLAQDITLTPFYTADNGQGYQVKTFIEGKQELLKITDEMTLADWVYGDESKQEGASRFLFYPAEHGFLCLDIDRGHKDGKDGLAFFSQYLAREGINLPIFADIPGGSFPVYTATPSGGYHLYFRVPGHLSATSCQLCPAVDIRYKAPLTAGGSVKNGRLYQLNTPEINRAPMLPLCLFNRLNRVIADPVRQPVKLKTWQEKRGYTIEQCLEYGRQDATSGGNHDIILSMAKRLRNGGYDLEDTLAAIESTPEHLNRHDKRDTMSCVKSLYR